MYVKLLVTNAAAGSIIGKVHAAAAVARRRPDRAAPARAARDTLPPCRSATLQGGNNINDFQARTFARIQLSKSQEYFPGTAERTLLISGRLKQASKRASAALAPPARPPQARQLEAKQWVELEAEQRAEQRAEPRAEGASTTGRAADTAA